MYVHNLVKLFMCMYTTWSIFHHQLITGRFQTWLVNCPLLRTRSKAAFTTFFWYFFTTALRWLVPYPPPLTTWLCDLIPLALVLYVRIISNAFCSILFWCRMYVYIYILDFCYWSSPCKLWILVFVFSFWYYIVVYRIVMCCLGFYACGIDLLRLAK